MFFFITFLRAFGAIIITNAHYTHVYPYPILASGGLLGDVIFFAVSGYCISQIKDNFFKWYKGRIIRVYTPVYIITIIYLILGFYNLKKWSMLEYFIYPTYYHFVASLMVIYIPLYFIIKHKKLKNSIIKIIGMSLVVQILIYVFYYDYTYYHIDTVREPMIRFLFFNSVLIGLYFKQNHQKFLNKTKLKDWLITLVLGVLYFISKLLFVKIQGISSYQILNQIILFIFLYYIFKSSLGIEEKLNRIPLLIKKIINFLASITLEIYLVQYIIIPKLSYFIFPLNWVIVSVTILISAFILNRISNRCIHFIKIRGEKHENTSNRSI